MTCRISNVTQPCDKNNEKDKNPVRKRKTFYLRVSRSLKRRVKYEQKNKKKNYV